MHILPINLDDLMQIESVRLEFKKSWSDPTLAQVLRTICAFANDFFNLYGGYIVLGVEEEGGIAKLPPHGLDNHDIDRIQKEIRGNCNRISPDYQPVLSPEIYQGKKILVIWCPAGDVRPYQAPTGKQDRPYAYYVRQGAESVEARDGILTQLMQMTAKIPFDDRRNLEATVDVVSPTLVRNFLSDINSDLVAPGVTINDLELYRSLKVLQKVNGYEVPKNIALLFFVNEPEQFFQGARIEVVQFGDDAGGDLIEEKVFRGPMHQQIRQTLDYLESFNTAIIKKIPNQAEVYRSVAFPYEAMEEAVVNAIYHRSYEGMPEPTKVYLYPDRMEVISYPGPVPGIEKEHFQPGITLPPVPNRNRRIGEFLKELRLAEGRGTGIPKIRRKMKENGSLTPVFEFDESRTYFRVILPAHPQYIVVQALRESAHLWATGDRMAAIRTLETAASKVPNSGALIAQRIEYLAGMGDLPAAERAFSGIQSDLQVMGRHLPYLAIANVLLNNNKLKEASDILARMPALSKPGEIVELAVLYKRSERFLEAHRVFQANFHLIENDPKALQEFAQTKIRLSMTQAKDFTAKKKLTREAVELLRRAISLSDDEVRKAWCWYEMAKSLAWLRVPKSEIEQAYGKALEILPNETRFKEDFQYWLNNRNR